MLRSFTAKIATAGVAVAGLTTFAAWDKSANYYPVEAKVMKVEAVCYLKGTDRKDGKKTSWTTEEGPCDKARMLAESHPEYKGATVYENNHVQLSYRAEGEPRSRRGEMTINRDTPKRGQKVTILVHREDPEKIRSQ